PRSFPVCLGSTTDLTNRAAEGRGRTQLAAAGFAFDGERGAEARVALGAAGTDLASALRALAGELALRLVEVALGEPARQAERDPIAKGFATLFTQPVGSFAHRP